MNPTDAHREAAEKATKAARKGVTLAKLRKIEAQFSTNLNITQHFDGIEFDGVDDWGQIVRIFQKDWSYGGIIRKYEIHNPLPNVRHIRIFHSDAPCIRLLWTQKRQQVNSNENYTESNLNALQGRIGFQHQKRAAIH